MADDVNLLRIIERIYDAATDPSTLGALAPEIAHEFGCDTSWLYVVQNPKGKSTDLLLSATANFDDQAHSSYTNYYRQRDIWGGETIKAGLATTHPIVIHGQEILDPNKLTRSEIYDEWFDKVGLFHCFAGLFPVGNDLGVFTIGRPAKAAALSQRDRERVNILVPHLQRAVQIHLRLSTAEQQRAMTFDMLERLTLGVFVVDADARVAFANSVGRRHLQAGVSLTSERGCVRLRHPAQQRQFEKTIRDAALTSVGQSTSAGGIVAVARPAGPPLSVLISPYGPGHPAADGARHFRRPRHPDADAREDHRSDVRSRAVGGAAGLGVDRRPDHGGLCRRRRHQHQHGEDPDAAGVLQDRVQSPDRRHPRRARQSADQAGQRRVCAPSRLRQRRRQLARRGPLISPALHPGDRAFFTWAASRKLAPMPAAATRLACPAAAALRALCAARLERAPSPRVWDNRLEPPRSDYTMNPAWGAADVAARPSAVLVPIVARADELSVILIERPPTMAAHAGEISFPGGKVEAADASPVATALREAEEEIGLARAHVDVLGFLDCYQVRTGFRIVPVVGLVTPPFTLEVDAREVVEAFEVPLAFLMDGANHEKHSRELRGETQHFYAMPWQGRNIWGATAAIIRNLFERLAG